MKNLKTLFLTSLSTNSHCHLNDIYCEGDTKKGYAISAVISFGEEQIQYHLDATLNNVRSLNPTLVGGRVEISFEEDVVADSLSGLDCIETLIIKGETANLLMLRLHKALINHLKLVFKL